MSNNNKIIDIFDSLKSLIFYFSNNQFIPKNKNAYHFKTLSNITSHS